MGGLAEDRVRARRREPRLARHRRSSNGSSPAMARSTSSTSRSTAAASRCWRCTSRWRWTCAPIVAGGQDQHRPGAGRRPRDQHRRGGHPLPQTPAGQGADRHPADGDDRAGDAARRARRLRPPRYAPWPRRSSNEDDALDALKTQVFRELLTYMLSGPVEDRARARPDPDLAPPRADRRPRHERRRGRHLHGPGARRPPSRHRAGSEGNR